MKTLFFNRITLALAFFAVLQDASAQWNTSKNPIYPFDLTAKVGIGTATPATKLNVLTAAQNDGIRVNQTGTTAASLSLQGGGAGAKLWALFSTGTGNGGAGNLTFFDWTTNSERMRIASDGNVGIGITAPLHKLHVEGRAMISGSTAGFGGPMLLFSNNTNTHPNGQWGIEYEPTQQGLNFYQPSNPGQTGFGNYYLFLKNDGKIGMGIDPADICPNGAFPGNYGLYVKNGILTEKVKVANYCSTNWADYVFAPDYDLKPLAEVESFIAENKHLPGIPSAGEIEKEGLDLADMLSKQMAKIEELTLHTIALSKRLEKLEAENDALKQKTDDE